MNTSYQHVLFGSKGAKRTGLVDLLDYSLRHYWKHISLCLAEPLEIHKLNEVDYRVWVRAALSNDECNALGSDYVKMVKRIFRDESPMSRTHQLYFARPHETHKILIAEDPVELHSPSSEALPSRWLSVETEVLSWNYAQLSSCDQAQLDAKFVSYKTEVRSLARKAFRSTGNTGKKLHFLYTVAVPAAFHGASRDERANQVLGAVFLVLVSSKRIPLRLWELLFLRISLWFYYSHSAEAIDSLIIRSGLDRYQGILEMLDVPLSSLTDKLLGVERDAQELRAVLYEPCRGLLAARRRIADYFRDGTWLDTPDGNGFKLKHNPGFYKDLREAQWTLAYVLAALRGESPRISLADEALAYEFTFFKKGGNKGAYANLARELDRFFPKELSNTSSDNHADVIEVLETFKDCLFSVLKPDFGGRFERYHLYTLLGVGDKPSEEEQHLCIIPKLLGGPFRTFAHFVEFLSMLFEQYKASLSVSNFTIEVMGCSCMEPSSTHDAHPPCRAEVVFTAPGGPWIRINDDRNKLAELDAFVERLERIVKKSVSDSSRTRLGDDDRHLGNFNSCFSYLCARVDEPPQVARLGNGKVSLRWTTLELLFDGPRFVIANL